MVITFDKIFFDWICRCNRSSRIDCEHETIAIWFLRCMPLDIFPATSENLPSVFMPLDSDSECSIVAQYLLKKKQIPFDIPSNAKTEKFPQGQVIVAKEDFCVQCNEKLCLKECKGDAKLLTRFGFVTITNVWMKRCRACSLDYTYSEISEGIFNFNNKFFMSYDLLNWLRNAVFEHTALSMEINLIEKQYREKISHDIVRRCFYKFLALTDDEEMFRCFLCGYHPVILTFDVNRKCAFKMENRNSCPPKEEEADLIKVWDNKYKVAMSGSTSKFVPSLEFWAPFIGKNTRKGDISEYLKGAQDNEEQEYLECWSE